MHNLSPPNKRCLSASKRQLIDLMQSINFGRIENLVVRNGEPVVNSAVRAFRTVKLAGNNRPRPETESTDFALKHEVVELLQHLASISDGIVPRIEIANGLPLLMEVEQKFAV